MIVKKSIKYNAFVCLMMAVLLLSYLSPLSVLAVETREGANIAPSGAGYNYFYTYEAYVNEHYYFVEQWSDLPLFLCLTDDSDNAYGLGYQLRSGEWIFTNSGLSWDTSWNPFFLRYTVKGPNYPDGPTFVKHGDTFLPHTMGLKLEELGNHTFPLFSSFQAGVDYYENGDDSGYLNKPLGFEDATYNEDIPTPALKFRPNTFDEFDEFYFTNASDSFHIQVQARWKSVDDVYMYKDKLSWRYRYSSVIDGPLEEWIPMETMQTSVGNFKLCSLPGATDSFVSFLSKYPIEHRSLASETNDLGIQYFQHDKYFDQLKNMLSLPGSAYNRPELYIRYFIVGDDGVQFGKWCHVYIKLAPEDSAVNSIDSLDDIYSQEVSDKGLLDEDKEDLESSGDSLGNDSDLVTTTPSDKTPGTSDAGLDGFIDALNSMNKVGNSFGGLVSSVFGWLPWWCSATIGAALVVIVACRILGR